MIRGMSVPIQDKIWRRMRKELTLLNELMNSDYLLISTCDGIRDLVESLTPETWRDGRGLSEIEDRLRDLDNIMRDRQRILQMV
jgi:hypothetical protein